MAFRMNMITDKRLQTLQDSIEHDIPLARCMQWTLLAFAHDSVRACMPLAPNINDKQCAFGGSLVSAMTLCGWSLIHLLLDEAMLQAEVFVADSHVRYMTPVWTDMQLTAQLSAETPADYFLDRLRTRGAARAAVTAHVRGADQSTDAASLTAQFVAKLTAGEVK